MTWQSSLGPAAQRLVRVEAPTDVAEARRQGLDLAAQAGLAEASAATLALAITEASSNIVKHAREGTVLLRLLAEDRNPGIEVLALDKGPGMPDVGRSMQDGYSTAGTPGNGLGAIARLTRSMEIYSRAGSGTALRFEVWDGTRTTRPPTDADLGSVCVAKSGESVCGDAWAAIREDQRTVLVLADGLGHGPHAAAAAEMALETVRRTAAAASALEAVTNVHRDLKGTRGAAGVVAILDFAQGRGRFCGIGNISCTLSHGRDSRQLVSHNGTLGHATRTLQEFDFEFPPGALMVAHTDGLNTHWRLDRYPGLERRHPALIAAVLFRDHSRGRDDATCVALRRPAEPAR